MLSRSLSSSLTWSPVSTLFCSEHLQTGAPLWQKRDTSRPGISPSLRSRNTRRSPQNFLRQELRCFFENPIQHSINRSRRLPQLRRFTISEQIVPHHILAGILAVRKRLEEEEQTWSSSESECEGTFERKNSLYSSALDFRQEKRRDFTSTAHIRIVTVHSIYLLEKGNIDTALLRAVLEFLSYACASRDEVILNEARRIFGWLVQFAEKVVRSCRLVCFRLIVYRRSILLSHALSAVHIRRCYRLLLTRFLSLKPSSICCDTWGR